MWDNFFFIGLPYIAIVLFIGGTIYRGLSGIMSGYRGRWDMSARGDFLWTTRSTGFFGRASIGPASLCLHWGIIILFVAHVVGLIGGAFNLVAWVDFFRWTGLAGGLLFCFGIVWAFVRRLVIPQVKAMSTPDDYIVLLFLIFIGGFGLYQSSVELVFGISYSAGPWIGGIFTLQGCFDDRGCADCQQAAHHPGALLFCLPALYQAGASLQLPVRVYRQALYFHEEIRGVEKVGKVWNSRTYLLDFCGVWTDGGRPAVAVDNRPLGKALRERSQKHRLRARHKERSKTGYEKVR